MRKKIVLNLLILLFPVSVFTQQSQVFTHPDITFLNGKELFNQGKYAASYPYFVDYLNIKQISSL